MKVIRWIKAYLTPDRTPDQRIYAEIQRTRDMLRDVK